MASQGGKGRKFGRNSRGGSMARYKALSRDKSNKQRKVAKHKAAIQNKKENPPKIARRTARMLRRHPQEITV